MKGKIFLDLMVSIRTPNNTIRFWTQFKTPHLIFKVLKKLSPYYLSNYMITFTLCHHIYWLTVLCTPRLFLKKLSKGNLFIAVKGQSLNDRLFFISKYSFEIHLHLYLFLFVCLFVLFPEKKQAHVPRHLVKMFNDSDFLCLVFFWTSSRFFQWRS